MYRLVLTTPPAVEPVLLADVKDHLRLEITADDALVAALALAARVACETMLGQSFVNTVWTMYLDAFPGGGGYYNRTVRQMGEGPMWLPQSGGGIIAIPRGPLFSVNSIQYLDQTSTLQTVSPSIYRIAPGNPGGKIQTVFGQVWPIPAPIIDAIQVSYTAGYGPDGTYVPEPIKLAIKMLAAHYYEDRESIGGVPGGISAILSASADGYYN